VQLRFVFGGKAFWNRVLPKPYGQFNGPSKRSQLRLADNTRENRHVFPDSRRTL
jgi:hypothetical protein